MYDINFISRIMIKRYKEITTDDLSEKKLQLLLYFAQKEAVALLGELFFSEEFLISNNYIGIPKVKEFYNQAGPYDEEKEIPDEIYYVINKVICDYGMYAKWKLKEVIKNDISWVNAVKNNATIIKNEDIIEAAEGVRQYDHIWDMYYDEFEDYSEE